MKDDVSLPIAEPEQPTQEEVKITRTEDLPDDPLSMPPPYWRSSCAIFHVLAALESMVKNVAQLPAVVAKTNRQLDDHYAEYGEQHESKEAMDAFSDICDNLHELEHLIKLDSERAILMSAYHC